MICSKCSIDKEADQYESYFHSTQNKIRTRKICKSCFNEQKKLYRQSIKNKKIIEPVPISVIPTPIPTNISTPTPEPLVKSKVFIDMEDTKVCYSCEVEKPLSEFYTNGKSGKIFSNCKKCELDISKERYQDYIKEHGGSQRVRTKPGVWIDKYQQEQVEGFLKVLGWEHNGKHWFKEGVRSGEDGVWEKMRGRPKYRKPLEKTKPNMVYLKLVEHMDDILKLREERKTFKYIAGIYNVSLPTLYKVIRTYNEKN